MKAFCEHCQQMVECTVETLDSEPVTVRGKQVYASQQHARCPHCGDEVFPNTLINYNVSHAHDAYRFAIGSITSAEIRSILEKYNIGAQPLSRLLGWGDNTIERQMKHTIPDREHANRLRTLNDPHEMLRLLHDGRERITPVAYERSLRAVKTYLAPDGCISSDYTVSLPNLAEVCRALHITAMDDFQALYQANYSTRSTMQPIYRLAFMK